MSSKTVEKARWLVYFDRVARGVLLLGGAFIFLRKIVASFQVCTAGEACPQPSLLKPSLQHCSV